MGLLLLCFPVITALCIAAFVYRPNKRIFIKDIQGPSYGWLLGNELDIWWQEHVGTVDFKWMADYGNVWRVGGCFGEDVLMVADPKALQYIFQGYKFPKRADFRQTIRLLTGTGLLWADGADHHRQKRIMEPAFGPAQLRSFFPVFRRKAGKLTSRLKEELQKSAGQTVNIAQWMAHTTLDIIGEVAFDYAFDTLDDKQTELANVYHNLFIESVTFPRKEALLFKALWCYAPEWILPLVEYLPAKQLDVFRKYMKVARKVAKQLLAEKAQDMQCDVHTRNKRDVMSLLVKANASQDAKHSMSEFEMISQMTTMMLAGHETTASSMNWILMELAKNPEYQTLVREEIRRIRREVIARGDDDFTMTDLENMPYMTAAIKETIRFHPIAYHLVKKAGQNDVIPLSKPIQTKSGKWISDIPVNKDQTVIVDVCAYNRNKDVFGDDAHTWNPYRYINPKKEQKDTVGVYANVLTFSSGTRACIGWRFSVIELHAIAVEILENFELAFPNDVSIRRVPAIAMTCMVDGELEKGVQMPLRITSVSE